MNNGLKYGLFFLGGLALGVVGTVAVTRGKLDLKPLATDHEQGGSRQGRYGRSGRRSPSGR